MLFKVALETIMRRLKDYEADQEKKGVLFEKYGHLDKAMEDEQNKILSLNDQIMEVEKQLQDLQNQFKELIKREYGDLYE
jgi:predicted  nucleic acid-binding Zn-ribbon protein